MDHVPRDLNPAQQEALRVLSRQVMSQLELRRQARELAGSEDRLRIVTDNARVGLVIVNRDPTPYDELATEVISEPIGTSVPRIAALLAS